MSAQAAPSPLPPTKVLKTERISQSAAHDFLTAYLDRASTDPSLQPDSTLSGHGPVSANTGAAPNLVIHNLKRVQAGLAGEILGRDLSLAKQAGVFELQSHQFTDGQNWSGKKANSGMHDGWQDLETFEKEQADLVQGGDGDDQQADEAGEGAGKQMDVDADDVPRTDAISKEERKRKKKERRKAEQRAKATGGN